MKIEGILIHKTPYKERDLIAKLLLRSGKTQSVYFYGGQGGGKSRKGSILELGHMVSVQLQERRKKLETDLVMAKEYQLLWSGKKIRENFMAFYLMSFYLELMSKVTLDDALDDIDDDHQQGLFNVLSNALYFLNEAVEKNQFNINSHLFLFFSKTLIQLGVSIDTEYCLFCNSQLDDHMVLFDPVNGGFACRECSSQKDQFLSDHKLLLNEYQNSTKLKEKLTLSVKSKYKKYDCLKEVDQSLTIALFQYINTQFELSKDSFKTWQMISSF